MIEFSCLNDISYNTSLSHNNNATGYGVISGVFDTGCTNTALGLYSLSRLLNISVKELSNYISQRIYSGCKVYYSGVASGDSIRSIFVCIHNCYIDNTYFEKFNCFVNIDDSLVETNGITRDINGKNIIQQPYALIGLDLIRSSRVEFYRDKVTIDDININEYNEFWSKIDKPINFYSDTLIGSEVSTKQVWDNDDLSLDV